MLTQTTVISFSNKLLREQVFCWDNVGDVKIKNKISKEKSAFLRILIYFIVEQECSFEFLD